MSRPFAADGGHCHRHHAAPEHRTPVPAPLVNWVVRLERPLAAPEFASGRDTGLCLPGSAASSLRTSRTILSYTPPEDHAVRNHAARCLPSGDPCSASDLSTA